MARPKFLMNTTLLAACGVLAFSPMAFAGEAVSGLNGKLDASVGLTNDETTAAITGAIAMPIGERYGFQLDGMAQSVDGDNTYGVAGHLFWRNPEAGLLGLYASHTMMDSGVDLDVTRAAVEGEVYWGQITLSGLAGYEFGDVDDGFFSVVDLSYYATDDFRAYVGHRYSQGGDMVAGGFEWQMYAESNAAPVLFVEGRAGDNDYESAMLGLRFYFGDSKSLIRRHREDDPAVRLLDDLFAISQCSSDTECLFGEEGDDEEEYYYYYS